jgi:hypothetical protein
MAKSAKDATLTHPTENAKRLTEHAEAIRALRKKTVDSIVEIGRRLIEAKELAGSGNWLSWLKDEFDWGDATAKRYMQVARMGRSLKLSDLARQRASRGWQRALAGPLGTGETKMRAQQVIQ